MGLFKTIAFFAFIYFVYVTFIGNESGCKKYASKYSCSYVEKKANYDVYYWFNVSAGNAQDEKFIGSAVGIYDCKNLAEFYTILPLTLPFLAKYSNEFLSTCLIEDVRVTELRLNN